MKGKRTLNFIETENVDVKQTKTLGSSARVHRVNIRLSRFQRFSDRRLGSSGEPTVVKYHKLGNYALYGQYTPRSPGSSGAHNKRKRVSTSMLDRLIGQYMQWERLLLCQYTPVS